MGALINSTRTKIRLFGLLFGVTLGGAAWAQIIPDADPHPTPDVPRPNYLAATHDPTFGHTVIRITDAGRAIFNPTGNRSLEGLMWDVETGHGYSSRVAWNADQSLLQMDKGTSPTVFLDGATYEPLFSRRLPGDGRRWHPTNPDVIYYVDQSRECIGGYNPRTDTKLWIRCFSGYDKLTWSDPGKGKPSLDGNIIPLRARRKSDDHWVAFLYYVDSGEVSDEIDMTLYVESGDKPDYTLSPRGDIIIINGCIIGHEGRCSAQVAIEVATKQELWRVLGYHSPGHADEAVDESGEQWRIGTSKSGDLKGHIIKRNFRTGEAVSLIPYWGSHTSTRSIKDSPGKAIVSFHAPRRGPYQNEVVAVCIDGSCLERYAHTHRVDDGRYLGESQASVSPSGDKIVFRSNWGVADGPIDTYVIELGSSSAPAPVPEPEPEPVTDADTDNMPPIASFDSVCSCKFIDASIDRDGSISAWSWDFGDGKTSSSPNPSHDYTRAGTYTVTLNVTDNEGATSDPVAQSVTLGEPPINLTVTGMLPNSVGVPATLVATISGTGFADGAEVNLSGGGDRIEVTNVTVQDPTTIEATIKTKPGGPAQPSTSDLIVTVSGSSATLAGALTVAP